MQRILLMALVLAAATLACNFLGSDTEQPAAPEQDQPTELESEPSEEQAGEEQPSDADSGGGPEFIDFDDPQTYQEPWELISSYRIALRFAYEGVSSDGVPLSGIVEANGERTLDPLAMSMTFEGIDTASFTGELPFSFSLIGDTYTFSGPLFGCGTLPAGEFEDPFSLLLDLGGFLTGTAPRMFPDEVINGVPAYGFTLADTNVEAGELDVAEFESGAVYMAQEGGYILRLEINGSGTSEMLSGVPDQVGDITYELNYYDFDQPLDIVPPEGCAQDMAELTFPVTEDAYQLSQVLGITSYKTDLPLEEVIQFYRDEMAANGWTLVEEFIAGPVALLSFSSDSGAAQITISQDEASGTVDVGIIEGG